MAQNINRVVLVGNLTKDPELRYLPSGTPLAELRLAVNERVKDSNSGQWGDRANYFTVTVWGGQAEACANHLAKGRAVAVDGRLRWSEWNASDGTKRQKVEVVAESVQFLGSREGGGQAAPSGTYGAPASSQPNHVDAPQGAGDFTGDDDIPF